MRVSLISGIMIRHDAISAATRDKAAALKEICQSAQIPLEMRIFVFMSDYDQDDDVKIVTNVNDILFDNHFLTSDLIIYDFGIYCELFDSIYLAPRSAAKIVQFHNVTSPELVPENNKEKIQRSLVQMANLFEADLIMSDSPFNTKTLMELGLNASKIVPLNLVIDIPNSKSSYSGFEEEKKGVIEILFVGRFVPAKGPLDAVKAIKSIVDSGELKVRLNLIGNLRLSSAECVDEIRNYISDNDLDKYIDLIGEADDSVLDYWYRRSDIFLIPSYHEGFCVPVIEALSRGCYVIAYDAGNLPNVVNGFGNVVKTGDVEALANAITKYIQIKMGKSSKELVMLNPDAGPMSEEDFIRSTRAYCDGFSFMNFKKRLQEILVHPPVGSGTEVDGMSVRHP